MEYFNSIFFKKKIMMIVTGIINFVIFVVMLTVLLFGSVNQFYYQIIILAFFTLFMTLRAAYILFEKVIVDKDKGVVSLKIIKKQFVISQIKAIEKVRQGQLRLITIDGKQYPISIDNEERFISLLLGINNRIVIV